MAENNHVYKISLDLTQSEASKQTLKSFKAALGESNADVANLNKLYRQLSETTEDTTKLQEQYTRAVESAVKAKSRELDQLEAQKVALIANKDITEDERALKLKELNDQSRQIKYQRALIKAQAAYYKVEQKIAKAESTENKDLTKKISLQEKLNKLLGKEGKLRQGISKVAGVAKGIAKAGGAAMGIAGGLVSAGQGAAENALERSTALKSLHYGIDPKVVDELFVKTGADIPSIVNALNRALSVGGTRDASTLIKLAKAELLNPGASLLMSMQSKVEKIDYANYFDQMRKAYGIQDMSEIISAATSAGIVQEGQISQSDYMSAYAALSATGLGSDEINKIIDGVIAQKSEDQTFIEAFNKANLMQFVDTKAAKNMAERTTLLKSLTDKQLSQTPEELQAQQTMEALRRFQLVKDKLMLKLLPMALKLLENGVPMILKLIGNIAEGVGRIVKWVSDDEDSNTGQQIVDAGKELQAAAKEFGEAFKKSPGDLLNDMTKFANGGIATHPSICGEAGPELVLPLTKPQRCEQLLNQYTTTNNFNIMGNPNSLSLSQQINTHKFIRTASMW